MFEISRHPQYTSFPLLFAAIALLSDSVWVYVAGLATFLYLHIGLIPVEEAVLRASHDWMHEEYVRTVPMYTHCEWLLSTSWPAFVLWCSRLSRCCLQTTEGRVNSSTAAGCERVEMLYVCFCTRAAPPTKKIKAGFFYLASTLSRYSRAPCTRSLLLLVCGWGFFPSAPSAGTLPTGSSELA